MLFLYPRISQPSYWSLFQRKTIISPGPLVFRKKVLGKHIRLVLTSM